MKPVFLECWQLNTFSLICLQVIHTDIPENLLSFISFGYSVVFNIPFHHHLLYNYLIIRDILLYISWCGIHLHPLLFVFENFPVTLKMYFLYFLLVLLIPDSTAGTAASEYLLSVSADSGSSWHCCCGCSNAVSHTDRSSGYWIPHFLFSICHALYLPFLPGCSLSALCL